MVPTTERDKRILKLASSFLDARGGKGYIPVRIEPSTRKDGTVAVIYWTPRRELQLLGARAVIVNPATETVELVSRD